MKKNIIITLIWFLGLCVFSYAGNENSEVKKGPSIEDAERARRMSEQQRPILPPMVSAVPLVISPTPSPHIATPQIPRQVISYPMQSPVPNIPQPAIIHQPQTMPVQIIVPQAHIPPPMPMEIPNPPIMGTVFGKVEDKGINKDGSLWLAVNDEMFGETVKIDILNLNKGIPLLKGAKIISFSDIKNGDTMDIIYREENETKIANFMRVVTQEELEMMSQPSEEQQLTVTSDQSEKKPEGSEKIEKENTSNQPEE